MIYTIFFFTSQKLDYTFIQGSIPPPANVRVLPCIFMAYMNYLEV